MEPWESAAPGEDVEWPSDTEESSLLTQAEQDVEE